MPPLFLYLLCLLQFRAKFILIWLARFSNYQVAAFRWRGCLIIWIARLIICPLQGRDFRLKKLRGRIFFIGVEYLRDIVFSCDERRIHI